MSVHQQKVSFGWEVVKHMTEKREKIYLNFGACILIFAYGMMNGTPGQWIISGIAFVQGVQVPVVLEAYLEAKQQDMHSTREPENRP